MASKSPPGPRSRGADYLCLVRNLTAENRLINAEILARMKSTAFLVNVAHRSVGRRTGLDRDALRFEADCRGGDSTSTKPNPCRVDSPLAAFDQVILGSHNANNLKSANAYVNKNTIDNLLKGLADVNR